MALVAGRVPFRTPAGTDTARPERSSPRRQTLRFAERFPQERVNWEKAINHFLATG
jgi:hypothetical protein